MRYAIFLICLIGLFACKSSNQTKTSYEKDSDIAVRETIAASDSSKLLEKRSSESSQELEQKTETTKQTVDSQYKQNQSSQLGYGKGYKRNQFFDEQGRLSSLQEEWWNTGHTQLDTSESGSSAVSVEDKKEEKQEAKHNKTKEEIEQNSGSDFRADLELDLELSEEFSSDAKKNSDTRLIQGAEWFYIALPLIVAVILFFGIRHFRKRNKK